VAQALLPAGSETRLDPPSCAGPGAGMSAGAAA